MSKKMSVRQEMSGNCLEIYIRKLITGIFYLRGYRIDSARPRYEKCFTILKDWEYIKFNFGLKQTAIFARNRDDL
jgi:hypothetical protein